MLWMVVIILVLIRVQILGQISNVSLVREPPSLNVFKFNDSNVKIPELNFRYKYDNVNLTDPAYGVFMNFSQPLPANFCD